MNEQLKYDPEDIESLMLHKHFDELLPDERTFVLKHLDSATEYEHLRETLMQSKEVFESDELSPPAAMKENLMHEFRAHHRRQSLWTVWLNTLFASGRPFYLQPAFQLATVALLFVAGGYWLLNQPAENTVAVEPSVREELPVPKQEFEAAAEVADMEEDARPQTASDNIAVEPTVVAPEENKMAEMVAEEVVSKSIAQSAPADYAAGTSFSDAAPAPVAARVATADTEIPTSPVNTQLLDLLFAAR